MAHDAVQRSLIMLKALTYAPTGGIVAAPTTSLPEHIGGVRNWDYRFCWLRDATLTLLALLTAGYDDEARRVARWLLRAAAGNPEDCRSCTASPASGGSPSSSSTGCRATRDRRPVRIGNAASEQLQLDVYGEVMDALYQARTRGLERERARLGAAARAASVSRERWREPDDGIWEIRGEPQHFTHSKVMAWVAFDRAVKSVEEYGLKGTVERWRAMRDEIHAEVCAQGLRRASSARFVQSYGSEHARREPAADPARRLPAADDPRVRGTIEAIQRELHVRRPRAALPTARTDVDGLPAGEGVFLPCSLLARRLPRADRRPTKRRTRCSSGCSGCATTSGCSPRSTTRSRSACSATSRRRSRTSRW